MLVGEPDELGLESAHPQPALRERLVELAEADGQSLIAIPDSEGLDPTRDPFYNGVTLAPYTWSIQVDGSLVPNGFKVKAVYHDGIALPLCSTTPISAGSPICVLTLTQDNKTKSLFATGEGITNGAYQFG